MLPGSQVTFQWVAGDTPVSEWWLYVGLQMGGIEMGDIGPLGSALSTTVNGLPTGDENVFVRLWLKVGGNWESRDFTYSAAGP